MARSHGRYSPKPSPHHLKVDVHIWIDPTWRALGRDQQVLMLMLASMPRPTHELWLPLELTEWTRLIGMTEWQSLRALRGLVEAGMVSVDGAVVWLLWTECLVPPSMPAHAERERNKLTDRVREAVFARDGRICRACGSTEHLHIDHVVPLARGGLTVMENLAVLCGPCNGSKGAHPWEEWIGARS